MTGRTAKSCTRSADLGPAQAHRSPPPTNAGAEALDVVVVHRSENAGVALLEPGVAQNRRARELIVHDQTTYCSSASTFTIHNMGQLQSEPLLG